MSATVDEGIDINVGEVNQELIALAAFLSSRLEGLTYEQAGDKASAMKLAIGAMMAKDMHGCSAAVDEWYRETSKHLCDIFYFGGKCPPGWTQLEAV